MQKVVSTLKVIISPKQNDSNVDQIISPSIDDNFNIEESISLEESIDLNKDLSIGSDINVLNNIVEINSSSQNQVSIADSKDTSLKSSFQITSSSRDSFESALNEINNI